MQVLATYVLRGLIAFLAVATLLPFLKVGYWPVRLCDFFRLQIAVVTVAAVLAIATWTSSSVGLRERVVWMSLGAAIAIWQLSHVIPYTSWWKKEIQTSNAAGGLVLASAVVNLKVENQNKQQVLEQLSELQVDLLLLIEIDDTWDQALKPLQSDYPHRHGVVRGDGVGLMLWSKIPLGNARTRHLVSPDRASIFATLLVNSEEHGPGCEIYFVGVHPLPPGLPDEDDEGRHDSRVRDAELMLVAKEVAQQPDKCWIVTGDFNDVAWSHTTRMFQRISGLADPRVGRGLYNTYHAQYPWIRFPIDQVFLSPGARIHRLGRFHPSGSDHFAITTEFSFIPGGQAPEPRNAGDLEEADEMIEEGREDAKKK